MKKSKILILILFLSCLVIPSINAEEMGSIKGSYTLDDHVFADTQVQLYRVADVKDLDTFSKFEYVEKYQDFNLNINSLESKEWQKYANELKKFISTNNIVFDKEVITDIDGNYEFGDLETGLYLIVIDDIETDKAIYSSLPTLISIPNYDEINKTYTSDIIVKNKIEETIPDEPVKEPDPVPDVPQTSDDIMIYVIIFVLAFIVLIGLGIYIYKTKREMNKNENNKD